MNIHLLGHGRGVLFLAQADAMGVDDAAVSLEAEERLEPLLLAVVAGVLREGREGGRERWKEGLEGEVFGRCLREKPQQREGASEFPLLDVHDRSMKDLHA